MDSLFPWEKELYIDMIRAEIEKQKEKQKEKEK